MEQPSSRLVPVTIPAAYEHVVQRIRRMITLGEVLPGEYLPPERALAESFQVSRVTVREALRILQGEGLIEPRRGPGGARVLGPAHTLAESRLRLRAAYDRMRENHEFRLAVEPMTAFLAAGRRDAEDIDRMEDANERIRLSRTVGEFRQADSAFHLSVAAAARNARLAQAVEDARSALFEVHDAQEHSVLQESSADGHDAVIDAIVAREAEQARRAMDEHIRAAWQEILAAIGGEPQADG
jgi:GntR family transcriptional regulator, transcriptional repressor for pyruvate dehydrogenase complex